MSFFSVLFPLCLIGAVILYYLLPKKVQWVFLLALSLGFYWFGGWKALLILGFTALTTWSAGLLLDGLNRKEKALPEGSEAVRKRLLARKRLVLALCLILNFDLLFVLKYWNFTAEVLGKAGLPDLSLSSLAVPLGLSFYLFQSTGYAIGCFRGRHEVQRNPFRYLLFVSFFPQMVQGPISRYDQLGPQLLAEHRFDAEQVRDGVQLVLWGYLKKLLLADRAAVVVRTVFGDPDRYGGFFYVFAVLLFCVRLYCDLSGVVDIGRGAAQMFGVELAEHFRRPIFAASLAEYWQRWQITLVNWMQDCVSEPLSRSGLFTALGRRTRKRFGEKPGARIPTACVVFFVWLLIGAWHGAGFRYLFFGLFNGVILAASVLLEEPFSRWRRAVGAEKRPGLFRAFQLLRTMAIVFVSRYFLCAPRLSLAFRMLLKTALHPCLFQLRDGTFGSLGLNGTDYLILGLGVALLLFVEWRQEKGVRIRQTLARQCFLIQWLAVLIPLVLLLWNTVFSGSAIDVSLIYPQF